MRGGGAWLAQAQSRQAGLAPAHLRDGVLRREHERRRGLAHAGDLAPLGVHLGEECLLQWGGRRGWRHARPHSSPPSSNLLRLEVVVGRHERLEALQDFARLCELLRVCALVRLQGGGGHNGGGEARGLTAPS